jgi:hypothetical protein
LVVPNSSDTDLRLGERIIAFEKLIARAAGRAALGPWQDGGGLQNKTWRIKDETGNHTA